MQYVLIGFTIPILYLYSQAIIPYYYHYKTNNFSFISSKIYKNISI